MFKKIMEYAMLKRADFFQVHCWLFQHFELSYYLLQQPAAWSWLNMTIIDHKFDATYHPKFTNTQNHFNSLASRYLFTSSFRCRSFQVIEFTKNSLVDLFNQMLAMVNRCNAADCNAAVCLKYTTVQWNEIFVSLRTTLVNERKSPGYEAVRGTLKI